MNRLIHRSWGEYFVNIFLDLFINISNDLESYTTHLSPNSDVMATPSRPTGGV